MIMIRTDQSSIYNLLTTKVYMFDLLVNNPNLTNLRSSTKLQPLTLLIINTKPNRTQKACKHIPLFVIPLHVFYITQRVSMLFRHLDLCKNVLIRKNKIIYEVCRHYLCFSLETICYMKNLILSSAFST